MKIFTAWFLSILAITGLVVAFLWWVESTMPKPEMDNAQSVVVTGIIAAVVLGVASLITLGVRENDKLIHERKMFQLKYNSKDYD